MQLAHIKSPASGMAATNGSSAGIQNGFYANSRSLVSTGMYATGMASIGARRGYPPTMTAQCLSVLSVIFAIVPVEILNDEF